MSVPPAENSLSRMLIKAKAVQERTDLQELREQGYTAVDMHVHTRFSDSFTSIRKLLAKARRKGIGVAITDHNQIEGVLRAKSYDNDVLVIPGIEVSTSEGPHILLYFYNVKELESFYRRYVQHAKNKNPHSTTYLGVQDLIRASKAYRCVVSVAHPFGPVYANVGNGIKRGMLESNLFDETDAIEAINGAMTKRSNAKAIECAESNNMAITGGSDSHALYEFGHILTCVKAGTVKEFLDGVKGRRSLVRGCPMGKVRRAPSLAKLSGKHMQYAVPMFPQQYEQIIARPYRYHKAAFKSKLKVTMDTLREEGIDILKHPQRLPRVVYKPASIFVKGALVRTLKPRRHRRIKINNTLTNSR